METRRKFLRKVGLTGIAAMGLPEILTGVKQMQTDNLNEPNNELVILFQGDSITDGNRSKNNDKSHILGLSYPYLIACRLWHDNPETKLTFYNRGINGNKVNDLAARWQKDTIDIKPDILSILVGVNDLYAIINNSYPYSLEKYGENYRKLLDNTWSSLPDTKIILCEPFILPLGRVNEKKEAWLNEIKKQQEIVRKIAGDYNAIFVELQYPFNKACERAPAEKWIWDGIHPLPAGHELIARQWIKEFQKEFTYIK